MTKEEFINNCNQDAIDAILLFIHQFHIVIDDELIEEQLQIPVTIGKIKTEKVSCAVGEYNELNDSITINEEELEKEEMMDLEDPRVAFYFTKAIIHERIHSLRRRKVDESKVGVPYVIGIEEGLFSNKSALEECITESLALMITYNYHRESTLEKLVERVKKLQNHVGEEVAATMIKEIGPQAIEWILTTRYQTTFTDMFASFLKEDYEKICNDITLLYEEESQDIEYAETLEKIIESHSINKNRIPER